MVEEGDVTYANGLCARGNPGIRIDRAPQGEEFGVTIGSRHFEVQL